MPFSHRITVKADDIDQMGHVNNVVYLRYVQEVAEAHWKSFASTELQKEVLWVVLRHEIDYKKPAFESDVLTGETWVEEASGPKMPRNVVLKNTKGEIVIQARTTWCALNSSTMRPQRIEESLYHQFK
ncbi:acyl-CoA thioesterase [Fulvivirga lutea]|uniref:Acyl-CoA thioesterase n=1 Tax=Fulvivirga lutea TaxID=2810512 RepID=A0A974WER9_9BACT|nr:thioesterase family protein [Fulvivirga lutea]QSE96068.1 acyl-CoA thioesterase [Fulvivirga lutea]